MRRMELAEVLVSRSRVRLARLGLREMKAANSSSETDRQFPSNSNSFRLEKPSRPDPSVAGFVRSLESKFSSWLSKLNFSV